MTTSGIGSQPGIASPGRRLPRSGDDKAAGLIHHEQRHALQDEHRGQRHDDGLQTQHRDEEAVEGTHRHADADADQSSTA